MQINSESFPHILPPNRDFQQLKLKAQVNKTETFMARVIFKFCILV
ncbi:predicted protein [Botrytis cinerea T4]|uniref:Uncharacterized protein n=1 Tax=Botryotinia fuckeliana (strain T4) TaxID=999810 RepID=G2YAP1_BOTF4|nr:predicted protein [Botrytis cinerea T4]